MREDLEQPPSEPDIRRSRTAGFVRWLDAPAVMICGAALVGYLGRLWWPLEFAAHFRLQYLVALVLLALANSLAKRRGFARFLWLVCLLNTSSILTASWPAGPVAAAGDPRLSVGVLNVLTSNDEHRLVIDLIRAENPDLFVAIEMDQGWLDSLDALTDSYPHHWGDPRDDNFGLAIYSKLPFDELRPLDIGACGRPSALVRVIVEGSPVTILATHPLAPVGRHAVQVRGRQLAGIPDELRGVEGATMVLGDLNCTPWSHHFTDLLEATGLRDSTIGFGVQPTWPAIPALMPMAIPIDHALVSDQIAVLDRRVGPAIGSDHWPLFLDLALVEEQSSIEP